MLISHMGGLLLSSYLIISQLFQFAFIPTFMYSTAIITIISDYYGSGRIQEALVLPKVASFFSISLFLILGAVTYFFKELLIQLITNQPALAHYAERILLIFLLANLFRPLFEIYKAAMQSVGQSVLVLKVSFTFECLCLLSMLFCSFVLQLNFYGVAICLFSNYSVLSLLMYHHYNKIFVLKRMEKVFKI